MAQPRKGRGHDCERLRVLPLKGAPQEPGPRRMSVWLHEQRSSVLPYGAPDQRTMFTPARIAIEKLDGQMVAERVHLPTKRRAYTRGPDRRPIIEMRMVTIGVSDVCFC